MSCHGENHVMLQKLTKGYNSLNKEVRVMSHVHCTSPQCPLSVYEVSLQYLQCFMRCVPDKGVPDGQTDIMMDGQTDIVFWAVQVRMVESMSC